MAQISSITLPNNSKYDIKGSIHTVIGTQTAATGTWTGELKTIDALYDGLTILYYLPYAGSGNATLNLTLKNGTTGAIDCYYAANTRLTTHYGAQMMILMTYYSAGSISIAGTATTNNRWYAHGQYNTTYSAMSKAEAWTGTATSSRVIRADYLKQILSNLGGTGLTLTHNATDGIVLNHDNSITAGTAGTSSATSGSTLAVPYVTYDAQGHITAAGTHTHTVTGFLTSSSSLDASKLTGTVPTSVLPSYVDDVLEYTAKANFPATGEEGKIYVDKTTNLTWRWGGSAYVEISPSLALGTTASTAAKGNHTHSFTPAGTIAVQTAGSTNNTLKPVTAKTVVTSATFNTVVTGGTKTSIPYITKKTVVTSASGATATYSGGTLTITNGSFGTGDSVTVGTAVEAYTSLSTGASGSATTGDSVTLGNAVTVKTGDAAYKFTGTAGTTGVPA